MQQSQLSQPYASAQERGVCFQMGHFILTGFPYYPSQHREENGMGLTDELPQISTHSFCRDRRKDRSPKVKGIDLIQMSSSTQ